MSSSQVNLEKYLIPLDEINRATDNFSRERYIGGGGFGSVYKGQLSERWQNHKVAVKRLDADSYQGEREFRNEIELISRFHHENIITFIGYYDEGGEMIIVYEYASNGSLEDHLRDPNKMSCITWAQRLEICIGAARGLHYLHSGLGEKNRVIHRDVKSANILLDGNMVAKICDFGLSKLGTTNQIDTQLYTKVAGTQYYLDPTYQESRILRKESDVYSFGVVLFEIMSGMLVYRDRSIGDERQSLMNIARRYYEMEPDKVIDPSIRDQIKSRSFDTFKIIAYQCISLNLKERPTLDNVVKKLEEALKNQLFERSIYRINTPTERSMIENLIGKLNSISPYDHWIASGEIAHLTSNCYENRVTFAQAGAIPRLIYLLTSPDSQTQEHAMTALLHLSFYKKNKGIIISSGAVSGIVHILEKGSNVSREKAAAAIYHLSLISEAKETIGSAGAIPPLVLLLNEGTASVKTNVAYSLHNLCVNTNDNRGRAVRAGAVASLIELLREPEVELKELSVVVLATLSEHPEGKLAIGEAEAVPHLVEVLGGGSWRCDEYAITILDQLCFMDQKYLMEAKKHGVMEKLKYVKEHGIYSEKTLAKKLERKIKNIKHDALVLTDLGLIAKAKRGALKLFQNL